MDFSFWQGRSIFITGHTCFKGSWLSLWLYKLGSEVHGYALDPPTSPNLFEAAKIRSLIASDVRSDLANLVRLRTAINEAQPEIVFHLAAQPLVRESYRNPIKTLDTNVIGTANLLESVRQSNSVRAVVIVTTDKVYENRERGDRYKESDPLGGQDVYSASKAAAEIVASAYRASFFADVSDNNARIATARSGNVLGGGDWAADRLVPDCIRALSHDGIVGLRLPNSVRPWQHVLEPLMGYMCLGESLMERNGGQYAKAWNFGPGVSDPTTAEEIVTIISRMWGKPIKIKLLPRDEFHESELLQLDSTLAQTALKWGSRWSLQQALEKTVQWYKDFYEGKDMTAVSLDQIHAYESANT